MPRRQSLGWLLDMLIPSMNGVRQRRRYIENEWLLNYRAWQGWPSQSYALPLADGGVHYYIPHARRAIERNVARATKLLMPNQDWFETLPTDGISHEHAEAVHAVMQYIYHKKLQTKKVISTLARCLYLYNFPILNTSVLFSRKELWPYQKAVDPFNFYIFPDTASTREEAQLIFEDCIIPYQAYLSYVDRENKENSLYEYIPSEDLHTPEWPYHLVERLAYRGLTTPSDFVQGTASLRLTEESLQERIRSTNESLSRQARAFVALSKVYFRLGSEWYYTVLCTNMGGMTTSSYNCKVVRLDEVENTPMYRWSNSRPLPGELYTNSPMDDIRVLQHLINGATSQIESNRATHAEPPLGVNSETVSRMESKTWANRKVWMVDGDPNQAFKTIDVEDTSTTGLRALQVYLGILDRGAGGTLAEGQPGRNMPRAGFAANTLLNVALIDVEDVADTAEQDLLTPGLSDVYHVLLEYVPESQIFKIPAKNLELVKAYSLEDLYGDYSFTWLGSLGFQDTQVRADKFLKFLEVLLNPVMLQVLLPELAQQGQQIDFISILKTIYTFGLGERGLGSIIIPAQQQPVAGQDQALQQQMEQQRQQHEQELLASQEDLQHQQQLHSLDLQGKVLDLRSKQEEARIKKASQLISLDSQREQARLKEQQVTSQKEQSSARRQNVQQRSRQRR